MASLNSLTWKLKRFGRFAPGSQVEDGKWKVFEAVDGKPELVLSIVETGHMLVSQGQELLDSVFLIGASDAVKVHQKSDNLIFRCVVKGGSRLMRMEFGGSSRAEALEKCSNAAVKLMEYLPVTTQDDTSSLPACSSTPNQPPTHFIGERTLSLPLAYQYSPLPQGELELFLRICLLDPSFPAFVEEVEGELRKLLQD